MNDLPTLPEHNSKPAGTPPAYVNVAVPTTMTDILQRPLTVAVIIIGLLLAAHAWSTRNTIQKLRIEMANRLQKGEVVNTETAATVRAVNDMARDLQAKITLLDNRQLEAQSQQLALEQMYQDLSKNRDEWALAEVEQVLSTASQQLQLAGNVQGALIALQNADRSLSRSDTPQFITIRRAIAKDTEKLKALPSLDLVGVALRIDNAIAQIDMLPMLADEKPVLPARPVRKDAAKAGTVAAPAVAAGDGILARARVTWAAWTDELWDELRQLIRVRKVGTPEALMISPEQTYFLRENLKLRLLNARLALMSRNEAAFRADMQAAQLALERYFDTRAAQTQTVQALLRQAQANNVAIELPSLSDSLNAVRNYKSKP